MSSTLKVVSTTPGCCCLLSTGTSSPASEHRENAGLSQVHLYSVRSTLQLLYHLQWCWTDQKQWPRRASASWQAHVLISSIPGCSFQTCILPRDIHNTVKLTGAGVSRGGSSGTGTIWGIWWLQEPSLKNSLTQFPGFAFSDTIGLSCPVATILILFTCEQAVSTSTPQQFFLPGLICSLCSFSWTFPRSLGKLLAQSLTERRRINTVLILKRESSNWWVVICKLLSSSLYN